MAVLIRGDREVNEVKLKNALDAPTCSSRPRRRSSRPPARRSASPARSASTGLADRRRPLGDGPRGRRHRRQRGRRPPRRAWCPGRDFQPAEFVRPPPRPRRRPLPALRPAPWSRSRGIEVGHIFKLGTKYSTADEVQLHRRGGAEQPMIMGCYGLGVGRTVAAAIEQNHDARRHHLAAAAGALRGAPGAAQRRPARGGRGRRAALRASSRAAGVDVLYDDRDERPG